MYEGIKPCPHRQVDDGGRILCGLIKSGDREVSLNLCRACPVPQINCQHLRATIQKRVSTPITVHYATGRTEVWDQDPPAVGFEHAACAEKTMPIHSPRDCTGCPLRLPLVVPTSVIEAARRSRPRPLPLEMEPAAARASIIAEIAAQTDMQPAERGQAALKRERPEQRQTNGHGPQARHLDGPSKIIQLQQWLTEQLGKRNSQPSAGAQARTAAPQPDEDGVSDIAYATAAPQYEERPGLERCVGWTD